MASGDAPNVSRVERQQRDDDPEANQVDENREEDDEQRSGHRFTVIPLIRIGVSRHVLHAVLDRRLHQRNLLDDVHAGDDAAEHGVAELVGRIAAMIERVIVGEVDVELRGRAAQRARPRHRDGAALVAQAVGRLVLYWRMASGLLVEIRGVAAALNHVAGDHAMEDRAGVEPFLHILQKVLYRCRRLLLEQLDGDGAHGGLDHDHRVAGGGLQGLGRGRRLSEKSEQDNRR